MTCAVLITPLVDVVPKIKDCDYIGVDAGALKIIDQKLPIKMAVGDFDSLDEEDLKRITCPIERHPIMKDETDSELAIRLCKDYDTIYLYGGMHGRIDHTIANIRLAMYRFNNLVLIDDHQKISVMNVGVHEIDSRYGMDSKSCFYNDFKSFNSVFICEWSYSIYTVYKEQKE